MFAWPQHVPYPGVEQLPIPKGRYASAAMQHNIDIDALMDQMTERASAR
ncbi:MAG: hypothetical protein AAF393_16335 [Pseudomonadota bacterium]